MTRKGIIAFSCFWASDIVLDPQLTNRREPPGVVTSRRFRMISQPTNLPGKRIQLFSPGLRHWPYATRQPDAPTHDIGHQVCHLDHGGNTKTL